MFKIFKKKGELEENGTHKWAKENIAAGTLKWRTKLHKDIPHIQLYVH